MFEALLTYGQSTKLIIEVRLNFPIRCDISINKCTYLHILRRSGYLLFISNYHAMLFEVEVKMLEAANPQVR